MRLSVFRLLATVGLAFCVALWMSTAPASARISFRTPSTLTLGCTINCNIPGVVASIASSTQFVYNSWSSRGPVTVLNPSAVAYPRGSTLKVGQTVRVAGSFNGTGQLVATNVTVFTIRHIATMAYDDYMGGGANASAADVNLLVSYAESSEIAGKGLGDCHSSSIGCKAVYYMRPYAVRDSSSPSCVMYPDATILASASESWFLHNTGYSDSAHRVYGYDKYGCRMWGMNPNSTALQARWKNYLRAKADSYDLYFVDISDMALRTATWFHSGGGCSPWPHVCLSTQELPNDAAVVAGHINFVSALSHNNGSKMYFLYQQAYPWWTLNLDQTALMTTDRYLGVTCEGCLAEISPGPVVNPINYGPYLDEMAATNKTPGAFTVMSKGSYPAGSAAQVLQRLVTLGVVWLGYSEGHTIVQPDLERNTNNLAIWPEDLIYPDDPVESMATGSADLEVSPGVYRREFAYCSQSGRYFGPCAAVVNATASTVAIQSSWLRKAYHHVITLVGGDVLSGGIANLSGAPFVAGATTIQAGGALLLAP